ncbi:hypothetical protein ACKI1J_48705, partial [Streptomyces scabiei]
MSTAAVSARRSGQVLADLIPSSRVRDVALVAGGAVLTGVAALGAAGAGGALVAGLGNGPAKPPTPVPAPGPPQRSPLKPSAYRLQPLTGYGAPRAAPGRPPVRSEPILRMTGRGRTMMLTFDDGPHPEYTPRILD